MSPTTLLLFAGLCLVASLLLRDLIGRARASKVPASDAPEGPQAVLAAVPDEGVRP